MEKKCISIAKRIKMLRISRILVFVLCIVNMAAISIEIISFILIGILIINVFVIGVGVNSQLDKSIKKYHSEEFKRYCHNNKILSLTQQRNYFFIKSKYYIETMDDKICKDDMELFQFEIFKTILSPLVLLIVIGVKSVFL